MRNGFGYAGQRAIPETGLLDYKARAYDPLLMRFIQGDSVVADPSNPQYFNRLSYVLNRPINLADPTGHRPACGVFGAGCESEVPTPSDLLDPGDPDYIGPIPENIVQDLVAQGADPVFLAMVTIHNKQDAQWKRNCRAGASAVTWETTIYFCINEPQYWDPTEATPTLMHELIHVGQLLEYPAEILDELRWIATLKWRDDAIAGWNRSWLGEHMGQVEFPRFDPYKHSWVEKQAADCANAFVVDRSIRLYSVPCNLAPFD